MPPKNMSEIVTTLLAVIGAAATCIGLVFRYIRKIDQLEADAREIRADFSELKGVVKAHQEMLNNISSQLVGITTRLDILIREGHV